jgi:hypothetical protein
MRIAVTPHAKQRASERLGSNPDQDWWERVAAYICGHKPDQRYRADDGQPREIYQVPTVGNAGEDVLLRVNVERHPGKMVFITLWVSSVDGDMEGPTWGRSYENAKAYVEDLYLRLAGVSNRARKKAARATSRR